jgi:protein-disulfide isomerase
MNSSLERMVSVALGCAAVAIVAVELHREFAPPAVAAVPGRPSIYVDDWRTLLPAAHLIGKPAAPVTVVVFTDFQCPFCRMFHKALTTAKARYPGAVTTAVVHLPLTGHRHAESAARAAECAGDAGRFTEAVDRLYEIQDSIGNLPWGVFASQAGVTDTVAFSRCMADSGTTRRVLLGTELAKSRSINSTPTVILNGWQYGTPPSETELLRAIGDILAGKRPYKEYRGALVRKGS